MFQSISFLVNFNLEFHEFQSEENTFFSFPQNKVNPTVNHRDEDISRFTR